MTTSKGWGVAVPHRKNQINHFISNSQPTMMTQAMNRYPVSYGSNAVATNRQLVFSPQQNNLAGNSMTLMQDNYNSGQWFNNETIRSNEAPTVSQRTAMTTQSFNHMQLMLASQQDSIGPMGDRTHDHDVY